MRNLILPLFSLSVISLFAADRGQDTGIEGIIRGLSPKKQTAPQSSSSNNDQFTVIKEFHHKAESSDNAPKQIPVEIEIDRIIDLSKNDEIVKLKIVNIEKENYQISYIVEFPHRAASDFDVYLLFLDKDGFEVLWRLLGTGAVTPEAKTKMLSDKSEPRYNLKGAFTIPKEVFRKIKTAELHFYQSETKK